MKNPPIYNQRMSFSKNEVRQAARFFVQKKIQKITWTHQKRFLLKALNYLYS